MRVFLAHYKHLRFYTGRWRALRIAARWTAMLPRKPRKIETEEEWDSRQW